MLKYVKGKCIERRLTRNRINFELSLRGETEGIFLSHRYFSVLSKFATISMCFFQLTELPSTRVSHFSARDIPSFLGTHSPQQLTFIWLSPTGP